MIWKPNQYEDTDYGLDPDESYEPADDQDEVRQISESAPRIQTVLGPILPEDAGVSLVKEHLIVEHGPGAGTPRDLILDDRDAALVDLESFYTVGGRTVVDVTLPHMGRSVGQLMWLAQLAPVHIVATTGISLPEVPESEMKSTLETDLSEGMDGTGAPPGLLHLRIDADVAQAQVSAAAPELAAYHLRLGLPLMVSAEYAQGLTALGAFDELDVPANRIIASVGDYATSHDDLKRVASTGALLLFDGLGSRGVEFDRKASSAVARLVEEGHLSQLLLSHGFRLRSLRTGFDGSPGFGYIVDQFAIMLLEAGVAALDVRTMLADNAAAALAIRPMEPTSLA